MARRRVRKTHPQLRMLPPVRDAAAEKMYLNRELSWLEFNGRVLDSACDASVPLAERLKFQGITASNLDEFFMVRVAGLKQQLSSDVTESGSDGMLPLEQLNEIARRVHAMADRLHSNWRSDIEPALAQSARVKLLRPKALSEKQRAAVKNYFTNEVWPVLTPLAIDQGHPFPALKNRSLNLIILLNQQKGRVTRRENTPAVVQVPAILPRLVPLPIESDPDSGKAEYILLEDAIAMHVGDLFPGFRVDSCSTFRVTRNFDLSIDEEDAVDLLKTIQKELRRRERGQAVRLEIEKDTPEHAIELLRTSLRLEANDIYAVAGPLNLADLSALYGRDELAPFRDPPFSPQFVPQLVEYDDIFSVIRQRDLLLHHPYESFEHVVDFISEAADDPNVLAIKQTLYRTSADSPIVRALARAAENGKQVTAVVELKARFDEGSNIEWARVLESSGVHVVYGLVGYKTHCKMSLVVRKEGRRLQRYLHLSTGNYNPSTARLYGDLSLFTARDAFTDDAGALFNFITGYSTPPRWNRFAVAPLGLQERVIELIDREARFGDKGRIIAKMNSLADGNTIRALCRASTAGVKIDLIVRGICCLRPGLPGISENIRVTSIVDRFLEHARIFHFGNGGESEVYLASSDWMPRNFVRRVEVMFPIEDAGIRQRLIDDVLAAQLQDNVKAHILQSDGSYVRVPTPDVPELRIRSQQRFIDLARSRPTNSDESPAKVQSLRVRTAPGSSSASSDVADPEKSAAG